MGEMVELASNGGTAPGYFATPERGAGIPLVVIQEWWGLVPHIEDVCDRFAAEGFAALAPDLFRGEKTTEPDEAGKLMMALNVAQAAKDMSGAVDFLLASDRTRGTKVGVTGFCIGGGLALVLACHRPDAIGACVPFYGLIPWEHAEPDWSKLEAPVLGHYAENDGFFGPDKAAELEQKLKDLGKEADLHIHPGCDHAFFNDSRPEVYNAEEARTAWLETLDFLRAHLG
ncbi:MAG: dienelactone hydrolase family protein [Acidimicrobiales bacterium]